MVDHFQRDLPDGGSSPRYRTVRLRVQACRSDAGMVALAKEPTLPNGRRRLEFLGTPEEACRLVDDECDDDELCADDGGTDLPVRTVQDRCACRARGQVCRYTGLDGGLQLMGFNNTYEAAQAPFAGPGCVRKSCVEVAGELGASMPAECR